MSQIIIWAELSSRERSAALDRPAVSNASRIDEAVSSIIARVRHEGDEALRALTLELDGVSCDELAVSEREIDAAFEAIDERDLAHLRRAKENIARFHDAQVCEPHAVITSPGVVCERIRRPIDAVGLYAPAGSAPLPSTVLMLGVPSQLAGCPIRALCTPPQPDGNAHPAILAAARLCGIETIFKVGGAQAIAALAYGTESVPDTDKIFGPGNAYVTAAKQAVSRDPHGAAIDMPAGPSEVLVIADDDADAEFVAADLLAQAEHGPDSQVVLVTPSIRLLHAVVAELDRQVRTLARAEVAAQALRHSRLVLVRSVEEAFDVSNAYAPEHLIVQTEEPRRWLAMISNAGSVFLGPWAPEAMGDYCSGTNHVLPTYGWSRSVSGLSLDDFTKRITVQEISPAGLRELGPTAVALASMERLDAHANSVAVRLARLATTPAADPADGHHDTSHGVRG